VNVLSEILPYIAGSLTSAFIDGALESIYESDPARWTNVFPFVGTIDPLPPADDWIVLAVPLASYAIGELTNDKFLKDFGVGGLLYAGPMIAHHTIVRYSRMTKK